MKYNFIKSYMWDVILFVLDVIPFALFVILMVFMWQDFKNILYYLFAFSCVPIWVADVVLHWKVERELLWSKERSCLSRLCGMLSTLAMILSVKILVDIFRNM